MAAEPSSGTSKARRGFPKCVVVVATQSKYAEQIPDRPFYGSGNVVTPITTQYLCAAGTQNAVQLASKTKISSPQVV